MKKPLPASYGLSELDIEKHKASESVSTPASVLQKITFGIGAITFVILFAKFYSLWGIKYLLGVLFASGMGAIFALFLSTAILLMMEWIFSPKRRAFSKYHSAEEEYKSWKTRQELAFWRSLSGLQFERELGALLARLGRDVTLTPASGDGGVDLILDQGGDKIAVQCKHYSKPVGPAVVRELFGAMHALGYKKGILVCTSGFSPGVHEFTKNRDIELWDIRHIIKMASESWSKE